MQLTLSQANNDIASGHQPNRRTLRAGPLSAMLANGELRYLRVGRTEVVRRIFVTVRDESWGTIVGRLRTANVSEHNHGFEVEASIAFTRPPVELSAALNISAKYEAASQTVDISYLLRATALSDFWTRRIGLCLLHPIEECIGRTCYVTHSDGEVERCRFPELVDPGEPFRDVQKLSYAVAPGLNVSIDFVGEVFQTEDQRNWSDGSFKTYCRPLSKPAPYRIAAGETVEQEICLRVAGVATFQADDDRTIITLDRSKRYTLPEIGTCLPIEDPAWTVNQLAALKLLNLGYLRIDVSADTNDCVPVDKLRHLLQLCNVSLEVGVTFSRRTPTRLPEIVRLIASIGNVGRWTAYDAGQPFVSLESVEVLASAAREAGTGGIVGGGTVGNFAELNRSRTVAGKLQLLAFPLNPQMHAMDGLSIVENLESHADTVRTARSFAAAGTHLSIGPVTFHRRPDPFAAGKNGEEAEKVFPDARQKTGLAAAWTIGSIAALSRAGADSVTYYQGFSPFGIVDGERPGPLAEVLAAVLALDNVDVIESTVSRPLRASTLAIRSGDKTRLIVGNLLDAPQQLELGFDFPSGAQCRRYDGSRTITETFGGGSGHADLHLKAYECMVIDWEGALS